MTLALVLAASVTSPAGITVIAIALVALALGVRAYIRQSWRAKIETEKPGDDSPTQHFLHDDD